MQFGVASCAFVVIVCAVASSVAHDGAAADQSSKLTLADERRRQPAQDAIREDVTTRHAQMADFASYMKESLPEEFDQLLDRDQRLFIWRYALELLSDFDNIGHMDACVMWVHSHAVKDLQPFLTTEGRMSATVAARTVDGVALCVCQAHARRLVSYLTDL